MKITRTISYLILFLLLQLLIWVFAWNGSLGSEVHPALIAALQAAGIWLFLLASGQPRRKKTIPVQQKKLDPVIHSDLPREVPFPDKFLAGLLRKNSPKSFGDQLIRNLSEEVEIMDAIFYCKEEEDYFKAVSVYALHEEGNIPGFRTGESLTGQAVKNAELTIIGEIPPDRRKVVSGLGSSKPSFLYLLPFTSEEEPIGLLEFSTFREVSQENLSGLKECMKAGGNLLGKLMKAGNG